MHPIHTYTIIFSSPSSHFLSFRKRRYLDPGIGKLCMHTHSPDIDPDQLQSCLGSRSILWVDSHIDDKVIEKKNLAMGSRYMTTYLGNYDGN